jgi:hypothetical protein
MYLWQDFRTDLLIQPKNEKFQNRLTTKRRIFFRSIFCFISKHLNKLDPWNLRNVRENIIQNSVRYVTVGPNAHIYLLLLYMVFLLGHVKNSVTYCEKINFIV